MRVQKLTMLNGVNSYKNYSTNPQFHKFAQVNFSAGNDEFVKGTENAFEITGRTLKKSLKEALQKASQTSSSLNISDQIDRINTNNEDIAQISEKYKILNNTIESALKKGKPEMAIKVGQWIEEMDKLAREGKGFKKVYGYQKIKNVLTKKFVFGDMMMDKVTGGHGNVPNALLVYGLPNNGKSLFAKALSEESLSHLEEISLAKLLIEAMKMHTSNERLAMNKILESAQNSLLNYKNNNGQRTIILINEAEVLADSASPINKEFSEFIQTCSDKYKCTLFLTTNNPTNFDKSILSQIPKDYKIGIEPPDKKTCKEIIYNVLNPIGKMPIEGTDNLVECFFKNPNKLYSNASIIDIIKNTLEEFNGRTPAIRDYQEIIKRNDVMPSITKADLDEFYKTKKTLEV